jgi:hypothetical protein
MRALKRMVSKMNNKEWPFKLELKNIFTEYDERLQKALNIDPMGLSVIWTDFGQRIFNNKISSVALDIRSFNINLFNHYIIRTLMFTYAGWFEKNKKETIEKLLIVLENMIIWSWFKNQDKWSENQRKGLLGTSKAISMWKDDKKVNVNFNEKFETLQLLKRQNILGVNGRYKGSFIQMRFFTNNYDEYFEENIFSDIKKLIECDQDLKLLSDAVLEFFNNMDVEKIPRDLYSKVFADTNKLANHMQEFWMKNLGFDTDEAKAIYNSVSIKNKIPWKTIFQQANDAYKSEKIETTIHVEPKLSYLNSLFQYLLFCDGCKVDSIEKSYFEKLKTINFSSEISVAKDSTQERLNKLGCIESIETFIAYHTEVMQDRGHEPWLKIYEEMIKVEVFSRENKEEIEKNLSLSIGEQPWIHDYYLRSVENIKRGLENEAL